MPFFFFIKTLSSPDISIYLEEDTDTVEKTFELVSETHYIYRCSFKRLTLTFCDYLQRNPELDPDPDSYKWIRTIRVHNTALLQFYAVELKTALLEQYYPLMSLSDYSSCLSPYWLPPPPPPPPPPTDEQITWKNDVDASANKPSG